jgi:predicted aconitase with swiveling domain
MKREGRAYAVGTANGRALVLREPLSLFGGIAVETGEIIDVAHPDRGRIMARRILVAPGGRGSSSSSSVLAEAIRLGTAPAGIVLAHVDPILVVGCLVAQSLYGLYVPLMVCPIEGIADGDLLAIRCDPGGSAELLAGTTL